MENTYILKAKECFLISEMLQDSGSNSWIPNGGGTSSTLYDALMEVDMDYQAEYSRCIVGQTVLDTMGEDLSASKGSEEDLDAMPVNSNQLFGNPVVAWELFLLEEGILTRHVVSIYRVKQTISVEFLD